MDGPHFLAYIEQILAPTLKKGDVVFMDNLSTHLLMNMNVGGRLSQWLPFFAWLSVLGLAIASWTPGEHMIRTGVRGSFEHIVAYFIPALMVVCAYPG